MNRVHLFFRRAQRETEAETVDLRPIEIVAQIVGRRFVHSSPCDRVNSSMRTEDYVQTRDMMAIVKQGGKRS